MSLQWKDANCKALLYVFMSMSQRFPRMWSSAYPQIWEICNKQNSSTNGKKLKYSIKKWIYILSQNFFKIKKLSLSKTTYSPNKCLKLKQSLDKGKQFMPQPILILNTNPWTNVQNWSSLHFGPGLRLCKTCWRLICLGDFLLLPEGLDDAWAEEVVVPGVLAEGHVHDHE